MIIRRIGLILCSISPVICLAGSSDIKSPLTVHQVARGTIPLVTASGTDINIPLAIRPKGNSFLQLGPDTYGVSGWTGYDVGMELLNRGTDTANSYGTYSELTAGDHAGQTLTGDAIVISSNPAAANNMQQLIGLDANAFPQLPPGKTMVQAVGAQAQVESYNSGTVNSAYGTQGFVTAKESSHINLAVAVNGAASATETGVVDTAINHYSTLGSLSTVPGAGTGVHFATSNLNGVSMGTCYGLFVGDLTGKATNGYALWNDSPGVFNITGNGTMDYYNPSFAIKYTPGGTNYERAVQQWNSNVLEYGTQAGGTGTLRAVKILGASLQTPDLTVPTVKLTPGLEPSSPTEGMIYSNSSDHHLYFYNGTTWKQLDN